MTTIRTNNSKTTAVSFFANGGDESDVMVFALQWDDYNNCFEYWFSIGKYYKSLKNAKRAAVKKMKEYGYTFNEKEMENLKFED